MKNLEFRNSFISIIKLLITAQCFVLIYYCLINNNLFIDTFITTLKLWLYKVVPPIFTFYIIVSILVKLNILDKILIIFRPLKIILKFDTNNAFNLFLTSIFLGNPGSANLIYNEYINDTITKRDYIKLVNCCGFITPLFIFTLFSENLYYSFIIYISHLLTYFISCALYNKNLNYGNKKINHDNLQTLSSIISVFYNVCEICLTIASIMVIANLIVSSLSLFNINKLLLIPLELTSGILKIITEYKNSFFALITISMLITFNGFCIHLQIFSQIKGIKYQYFFIIKIIQSLFSGLITFLLLLI